MCNLQLAFPLRHLKVEQSLKKKERTEEILKIRINNKHRGYSTRGIRDVRITRIFGEYEARRGALLVWRMKRLSVRSLTVIARLQGESERDGRDVLSRDSDKRAL